MRRSVAEAAAAMAGEVRGADGARWWDGISFDTRTLSAEQLFFAFRGSQVDGHRFVPEALARGAAAAVVEEESAPLPPGSLTVRVRSSFEALHALTRHVRSQTPEHLVGITGSAGKTTTKEILATFLALRFRVARSPGNLNNLYGFPLALLNIPDSTEWMVAEMGMSSPGELRGISLLGRPDVVVFTNVREAHLEFFGSLAAIARAKAEILAGLAAGGLVVANADDPEVEAIARRAEGDGRRVVRFALEAAAEVRARELTLHSDGEGTSFTLVHRGPRGKGAVPVELPLPGRHNVENFLAAAAAALEIGVPLDEIAAAAGGLRPAHGRGEVHRLADRVTVVDDSYNSNPAALARALETAAEVPAERRWAVLGDMLELGPEAPRFHRLGGLEAARRGFSPVVAVGSYAAEVAAGARLGGAESQAYATVPEALGRVLEELQPGDLVLVKGSRGVGLDRVVAELLTAAGPRGER